MSSSPVLHDNAQAPTGYQALKDQVLPATLDVILPTFRAIHV
ncbi:MAG: hypothetical protein ACXWAT_09740 [Methylobacter sp.]